MKATDEHGVRRFTFGMLEVNFLLHFLGYLKKIDYLCR